MEAKKYFCSSSSTIVRIYVGFAILFSAITVLCVILLLSPVLMYRFYDSGILDFMWEIIDNDDPYLIMPVFALIGALLSFMLIKNVRRMVKSPVLEITDDGISVTNLNNSLVNVIKYQDIERFELSQIKILGKTISCINIIPVEGTYDKLLARYKKVERRRIEYLYKKYGAIEQIYEHLLSHTAAVVYEDLQEGLNAYKNA